MKKRALVLVGHTQKSQGATAYNGEPEWTYNKKVSDAMARIHAEDTRAFDLVFKTKTTWTKLEAELEAESLGYDASIELHFNSFSKEAYGCESLVLKHEPASHRFGQRVTKELFENFGIKVRHGDGVNELTPASRGYQNLKVVSQFCDASILIEPCFANFPTKEAKTIIENWENYARTLHYAIGEFLK